MDFLNRAKEQAKKLQPKLDEAAAKAEDVLKEGVAQAQPHLQQLADQAKRFSAGRRPKEPGSP